MRLVLSGAALLGTGPPGDWACAQDTATASSQNPTSFPHFSSCESEGKNKHVQYLTGQQL